MARKLVLTGTHLTDASAPRLIEIDPIESVGSIYLFDWTHPAAPMAAGLPVNGATAPNLLATLGEATIGEPASATFSGASTDYNGTKGLIERSGKGGVHAVVSPTLADVTLDYRIMGSESINDYVRTHPSNSFYLSVWGYITKSATSVTNSTPGYRASISKFVSPSGNYLIVLSNSNYSSGGRAASAVGASIHNYADASWSGGSAPVDGDMRIALMSMPPEPAWNFTDEMRRIQGGFIHYRSYLEDLTVSGRTYAELDALDLALFTQEVLTTGGRYYGDTFTDPASIT